MKKKKCGYFLLVCRQDSNMWIPYDHESPFYILLSRDNHKIK